MNYSLPSDPDQTVVDHNIGRSYFGINDAPLLSIKCMFNGEARYVADGRREFLVDDSCYVILNQGNAYSVEKRSITPVETFCVFFPPGLAENVASDIWLGEERSLDRLDAPSAGSFCFLEHRRSHGDGISARVLALRNALARHEVTDLYLEEQLIVLLGAMLLAESTVVKRVARLPRVRAATRFETFRRVQRGCDYLHANLGQPLSLAEISRAAAMSPYHFLRSFRSVFGMTPFAYLRNARLQKASRLLLRTHLSVTEVATSVGFESSNSFINLFSRAFGLPPSRFRTARKSSNPE